MLFVRGKGPFYILVVASVGEGLRVDTMPMMQKNNTGEDRGAAALGGLEYLTVNSNLRQLWLHTKTGPGKFGDVVTPPGRWTTSGPLSRECSQQDLPCHPFVGNSGHMPETTQDSW